MSQENCSPSVPQSKADVNVKFAGRERQSHRTEGSVQFAQQLTLFELPLDTPQDPVPKLFKKRRKHQISCIPGIDLRNPYKYRVMAGDKILGAHLTMDEARNLAKRGAK